MITEEEIFVIFIENGNKIHQLICHASGGIDIYETHHEQVEILQVQN